jgi:hypothetical protein
VAGVLGKAIRPPIVLAFVAAPAMAASAPPPAPLVGLWGKTITAATWHNSGIDYEAAGHWGLAISKSGVASILNLPGRPGYLITTMRLTATRGSVVFGPTADGFCPGKASYTWKASGKTLTLKLVKDGCDARRVYLTGVWQRG